MEQAEAAAGNPAARTLPTYRRPRRAPRQPFTLLRYGNSARAFVQIRNHAINRLALLVAKRHKQHRHYGWQVVVHLSPDYLGLINLNGSVVAPRPHRDWREKPNAGGERRR